VQFQNHILFLNELDRPFDPNDVFRFVPERTTINSESGMISEWSSSIADFGMLPHNLKQPQLNGSLEAERVGLLADMSFIK